MMRRWPQGQHGSSQLSLTPGAGLARSEQNVIHPQGAGQGGFR